MLKQSLSKGNKYLSYYLCNVNFKPQHNFCEKHSKERMEMIKNIEEINEGQIKEFYSYTVYEDKLIPILDKVNDKKGKFSSYFRRIYFPMTVFLGYNQHFFTMAGPALAYFDYFLVLSGIFGLAYFEKNQYDWIKKIQNGVWKIDLNKDMESVILYVGGQAKEHSIFVKICDLDVIQEKDLYCKIQYKNDKTNEHCTSDVYIDLNEKANLVFENAKSYGYEQMVNKDYEPIPNKLLLYYIIFGINEEVKKFTFKQKKLTLGKLAQNNINYLDENSK